MLNTDNEVDSEGDEKNLLEGAKLADSKPSRTKQRAMVVTILFLQFCALCADTIIFPFFPSIGKKKGLSNTEIGGTFSSFDLSRCIASPLFGSLVRPVLDQTWYTMSSIVPILHYLDIL